MWRDSSGRESAHVVAFLTLLHAAVSFESINDRHSFCIKFTEACLPDINGVWAVVGKAIAARAGKGEEGGAK